MREILMQIINPDVVLPIVDNNGQNELIVKETDASSKISKLTVKGISNNAFAFSLDFVADRNDPRRSCFKQLSAYLHPENNQGINKGCDAVLFTEHKNKYYILILDIKSDRPNKAATEKQLDNSELFIKYLVMLLRNNGLSQDLASFIIQKTFTTTRIIKGRSHTSNNSSVKYLQVPVSSNDGKAYVHLGKLLGR